MAVWNPPYELNGFPLSERSRWLMFAPIDLLIGPIGTMRKWEPLLRANSPFLSGEYGEMANPSDDRVRFYASKGVFSRANKFRGAEPLRSLAKAPTP